MSFWTFSKSGFRTITLTVLRRLKWITDKIHHVSVCLIKHILPSQLQHRFNCSLIWIPRISFLATLNNRPWSTLFWLTKTEKNAIHAWPCREKAYRSELYFKVRTIHLKIEYNKICQGFQWQNYPNTCKLLSATANHWDLRFSPSFFSFMIPFIT